MTAWVWITQGHDCSSELVSDCNLGSPSSLAFLPALWVVTKDLFASMTHSSTFCCLLPTTLVVSSQPRVQVRSSEVLNCQSDVTVRVKQGLSELPFVLLASRTPSLSRVHFLFDYFNYSSVRIQKTTHSFSFIHETPWNSHLMSYFQLFSFVRLQFLQSCSYFWNNWTKCVPWTHRYSHLLWCSEMFNLNIYNFTEAVCKSFILRPQHKLKYCDLDYSTQLDMNFKVFSCI